MADMLTWFIQHLSDHITSILALLVFIYVLRQCWKPLGFPPGPPKLPLLGSLPFLSGNKIKELGVLDYLANKYGDITGFYNGNIPIVVISDPVALRHLFKMDEVSMRAPIKPFHELRWGSSDGQSRGLLFSSGQEWKDQRRFALRSLRDLGFGKSSMEERIIIEVKKLTELLEKQHTGKPTSLNLVMNVSIANALMAILVGEELELNDPQLANIVGILDALISANAAVSPLLLALGPVFVKLFDPHFQRSRFFNQKLIALIKPYIRNHQKEFDPDNCKDFIDLYLKRISKTSDALSSFHGQTGQHSLISSLLDLFLVGMETTTTSLLWGFLLMAKHVQVQARVQQELDSVLGDRPQPCLEDQKNLPYTCAVISEVLRVSSIGHKAIPHYTTSEVHINGFTIPKNSHVYSHLKRIHYDEKYWSDPASFNPERFYDQDRNKYIPNINLVAFGIGKRICLGQTLAEEELFLFFVGLMKVFSFAPSPDDPLPSTGYEVGTKVGIVRSPPLYKVILNSRL